MKKILVLILLVFSYTLAFCQIFNRYGNPFITNYTPDIYGGNEQVWCVTQDDRGIMYFGTNDNGILEYDGKSWRIIPTPDNLSVRSICKGDDGVIYVGSSAEFGYLEPNKNGTLGYVSLVHLLPDSIKQSLSYIYKTYWKDGKVYFCSLSFIFEYNGKTLRPIYLGKQSEFANFFTLQANNTFYINSYLKGLRTLVSGNNLKVIPGGESFIQKNVFSIVALSNDLLLIFTDKGFYSYNISGRTLKPVDSPNKLAKKMAGEFAIPYNAIKLNNGSIGLGIVQSDWLGVVELTPDLHEVSLINTETGMHAAQVAEIYQRSDAPVWAALYDGGIGKIELNSSIRKIGTEAGLKEIVIDIVRYNGILYFATFNGVYYLTYDSNGVPRVKPVEGISGNVWQFYVFNPPGSKPILLAASYLEGVFEIRGNAAVNVSRPLIERLGLEQKVQHKCFSLFQSRRNPKRLYIGLTSGIAFMDWEKGGWSNTDNLLRDSVRFEIRSITEDDYGNLWLATGTSGIYMISPDLKPRLFDKECFTGISSLQYLTVFTANDSVYVLSSDGVYHYNRNSTRFERGGMIGKLANRSGIYKMQAFNNGYVALCYDKSNRAWVDLFVKDSLGNWVTDSRHLKRLPGKWADAIYCDGPDVLWIGVSKELFSFNSTVKRKFDAPFNALIRRVISKDSLFFDGTFYKEDSARRVPSLVQYPIQIPRLPYHFNAMVISYAAPYFEREEDIVYSHYLEGSDEETWSPWEKKTEATYTNLREGKYIFHVKARNIYGDESKEATYSFEIRPPWYRTILAYIVYLILFILLVWGIVKWNTRRLIAEKERLEEIVRQRTAEVVAQKEEIEQQKEKIAAQNEEITSSIQYASRIQSALLTPPDQVNKIFPENFILYLPRDIVSGDFYYITQVGSYKVCVVADCTGHGVPGGFMSMLGISFLTQIIGSKQNLQAHEILNELRKLVISALHQTGEIGGSKDGMDIALYILDEETQTLQFAGANNPLILIRDNELTHIKGDKMPIGIHLRGELSFTNNVMEIRKGDVIYTFSDGYVDQFGGDDGRKFMIKHFKELLLEIHRKPMSEQRDILDKTLKEWHGDTPRIDDVVVMGVRIV